MTNQQEGLISLKDCASLYSVSLGTISNWMKSNKDFPQPVEVPNSKRILLSKQEVHDYLKVLLDQRRTAPLTDHTGKKNDTSHLSKEQLLQRRLNKPEGWTEETKHDPVWDSIGSNSDDK